jgi:hypothetical protein
MFLKGLVQKFIKREENSGIQQPMKSTEPIISTTPLFITQLEEAIAQLEKGNAKYLHSTYMVFATESQSLIRKGAKAIACLLKSYSMKKMIDLSEQFRQYTSLDWFVDWSKVELDFIRECCCSEEDYVYILIVGTFHPNGYYREKCLKELIKYENTLPYLILRMNDWVKIIRDYAVKAVMGKMEHSSLLDLLGAIPALDKVQNSGRRDREDLLKIQTFLEEIIGRNREILTMEDIFKYDDTIRRSIYRYLITDQILDFYTAKHLFEREKNGVCQIMIISGLLKYEDCNIDQLDQLLHHKNPVVRRRVLERKYTLVKDYWPELERMLLDTNAGVREQTSYILRHYSTIDIEEYYMEALQGEDFLQAIIGLGDLGNKDIADILKPYLIDFRERVVKAALTSIGRLLEDEGEDIYWNYLLDERISVSKAAYTIISKNKIYYGVNILYDGLCSSSMPHVKRYILNLLLRENSWKSLPYLIYLYQEPEFEKYRDKILRGMHIRKLYYTVRQEEAKKIEDALTAYGKFLPEGLEKAIRFELKYAAK